MKTKDLDTTRTASVEELKKKIQESEESLARIARERYTRQSRNLREARSIRKSLAQMKTILREKELVA